MSEEQYLLRAADIEAMAGTTKQHFLNDNAVCVAKTIGDMVGITGFGIHIMEVQPGRDSTEHHFHFNEDECIYILSGTGTAMIGDEVFEVGAGDFMGYRKGGLAHSLKNTGTEVLRCLTVGNRHKTDVVEFPNKQKRMFRSDGLHWQVVDHADSTDRPVPKKD